MKKNVENNIYTNDIRIEIVSKKSLLSPAIEKQKQLELLEKEMAFDTVYKEYKEDKVAKVIDSPVLKVFGLLFNPSTMVLILYLSSIGWSKVMWLQRIFKIFGKGVLAKKNNQNENDVVPDEQLPFQIFECEVCKLEMRPARGRAETIFGRKQFRCSRCGAKASSFFDVEDMTDERAVARLKRIENEQNSMFDDESDDGDDYGDDDEYDDDDDDVDFGDE